MNNGFNRLRGMAAASAMGLGLIGVGSARAETVVTNGTANINLIGGAQWLNIKNANDVFNYPPGVNTIEGIMDTETGFGIADANDNAGLTNAFNHAMHMSVAGILFKNPAGYVDTATNTVTTPDVGGPGVTTGLADVKTIIEFYSFPDRPVLRALYSFINTNSFNSKTFTVSIGGGLGSADATTIQKTVDSGDDHDEIVDDDDLWIMSSSNILGESPSEHVAEDTPIITISRYGIGSNVVPTNTIQLGNGSDSRKGNFLHDYLITVPAGETKKILIFVELSRTLSDAKDCAEDFQSLTAASDAGLLQGIPLTDLVLNRITNYDSVGNEPAAAVSDCYHVTGGNPSDFVPTNNNNNNNDEEEFGALSIPSAAALIGLLGLARIRQKKHKD